MRVELFCRFDYQFAIVRSLEGHGNNMKNSVITVIIIAVFLFVSGCSGDTVEESAPEPTPTTRALPDYTPETECIHFWKDPDCFDPYICYDCGETRDQPIDHIWTVANFQEPSLCEICGETDGEPVEPDFLRHGFRINTTAGRPFKYNTITNQDPDVATVGEVTLLYIDIFESDTGYPEKPGYEYIVARFMITFDDENARENGFQYMTGQFDYFSFDPDENAIAHDDLPDSETADFKVANRTLNFFGEDYSYYIKYEQIENIWVRETSYVVLEYVFLVPAGYDGIVVYISNAANVTDSGVRKLSDNFDNDTLFFRLRTQTS